MGDQPGDPQDKGHLIRLSGRQQTAVAAALTIVSALVIICALLGLGWLLVVFSRRFSHVFLPLTVGAIAALVFRPYFALLRERLRFPVPLALVAVFLSVLIPLVAFGWFFGAVAVDQISEMVTRFPAWWDQTSDQFQERWPQIKHFLQENPWGQRLRTMAEGQQEKLGAGLQMAMGTALSAGRGILGAVGVVVAWAMFPVYFAFFLIADPRPRGDLSKYLPFLKADTRDDVIYLGTQFVDIVVAFFRGQLIIAFMQGVLFAVGFSLVGLKYGFILGLLLGLLNIIPYLGSILGLGVGLPLALFQADGGWPIVIGVIVVFTVVQMIEGYLLTPKIMGDRTGLHPLSIIVAVFFWGSALQGILGMILAIPLTAFLAVLWRLAREKYIGEWV
jgi:predicted PurR-regulated permease PerM